MTDKPTTDLMRIRQQVRSRSNPSQLALNGMQSRHVLEDSDASHRDPARLDTDLASEARGDGLTPDERREHLQMALRRAWVSRGLNLEELEPYRVRIAWRWVREVAVLKNLVSDDGLLADTTLGVDSGDPWHDGTTGTTPMSSSYSHMRADIILELHEDGGLPLLPPEVPERYFDEHGQLVPEYDPHFDPKLMQWLTTFRKVSHYHGFLHGSEDNPDEGRWGLMGMLDPDTVRLCFPSILQILTWEEVLVKQVWDLLVEGGQLDAERQIKQQYGLAPAEIKRLIRMAGFYGLAHYSSDIETYRALQCARLEEFILRCREPPADPRAELAALKQLATIRGLTANQADDFMKEAITIVREVGAKRALTAPPIRPQLPDA